MNACVFTHSTNPIVLRAFYMAGAWTVLHGDITVGWYHLDSQLETSGDKTECPLAWAVLTRAWFIGKGHDSKSNHDCLKSIPVASGNLIIGFMWQSTTSKFRSISVPPMAEVSALNGALGLSGSLTYGHWSWSQEEVFWFGLLPQGTWAKKWLKQQTLILQFWKLRSLDQSVSRFGSWHWPFSWLLEPLPHWVLTWRWQRERTGLSSSS